MKVYELINVLDLMDNIWIYRQCQYSVYRGLVANFTDDLKILEADIVKVTRLDNEVKIIISEDWN